jgi:hypothetical protein
MLETNAETPPRHLMTLGVQLAFDLGAESYRRSEEGWEEAGRPSARVALLLIPNELVVDVAVRKQGELTFVPEGASNPYDNEPSDINGDGVQLYVVDSTGTSGWVIVPDTRAPDRDSVRARVVDGWDSPHVLRGTWRRTGDGYSLRLRISSSIGDSSTREFALGVVVNEKPPGRERRRGQLVLGGAAGEFVYLRGDRESRERLPRFRVSP